MDTERLEHELYLLRGKDVSIVRPFGGDQSDSFAGSLVVHADEYPTTFEFQSSFIAIRFKATDVIRVKGIVIYLKGMDDYRSQYQKTVS